MPRSGPVLTVMAALVLVAGSACGNRADHDDALSAATSERPVITAPTVAAGHESTYDLGNNSAGGDVQAANPIGPVGGGRAATASGVTAGGGGRAARVTTTGPGGPATGRAAEPSARAIGGGTPPTGGDGGPQPPEHVGAAPRAPGPAMAGPKSLVKLGSVAALSGPVGATELPMVQGGQLWASWINRHGGVNGHQVQIIVADDGGDPARHKALVQRMIEDERVIALINLLEPTVGPSAQKYIESKRVPVIGGTGGEPWFYDSPMFFPQMSSGQALLNVDFGNTARVAIARNKRKVGALTCAEVKLCRTYNQQAEEQMNRRGARLVYKAEASVTQPDFTAECLAARNAGTEIFFMFTDLSSIRRIVSSCARQGYRPIFAANNGGTDADFAHDPNMHDFIAGAPTFPFFQDNTPAAAEFQTALRDSKLKVSPGLGVGWVSGKLFEKAAANLPEPPTSDAVLEGLWSIKNDDLGGITHPLTFTKDQNAPEVSCWIDMALIDGTWTSGFKRVCD